MQMKLPLVVHSKGVKMLKVSKKVITPIIKTLRFLKLKLQTKLNLIDYDTVYFEGGLGSQLLSYIQFRHKYEKNKEIQCDLTYFKEITKDTHVKNNVSLWSFKLDNYGIMINDLPSKKKKSRLKIKPKYIPLDFIGIDKIFLNKIKSDIRSNIQNLHSYLKKHRIAIDDPYGVIHLRKGDYLFVASHLINEQQVINLISKISTFLPKKVFISSDGEIDKTLFEWFKSNRPDIQLEQTENEIDSILLHDLMRNSRILIASNSTFSFSAALLSTENTISFVPQIFYQEDFRRHRESSFHQFALDYGILKY